MDHRIIDQQLDVLRDKILLLGGATESAVQRAMESLVERDSELAKQVLEEEKAIDQMELEIDRLSIEILAQVLRSSPEDVPRPVELAQT